MLQFQSRRKEGHLLPTQTVTMPSRTWLCKCRSTPGCPVNDGLFSSAPAAGWQEMGTSAMARYNDQSGNIGFAPGNVPGSTDYAYVDMQPGSSFSGWVPANGMIWMLPAAFTTGPLDLAATIAHEEGGHQSGMDGFGHNTGVGEMWARVCTGEN